MRAFAAQPDHLRVFHYVIDSLDFFEDLNMIAMIGTSHSFIHSFIHSQAVGPTMAI